MHPFCSPFPHFTFFLDSTFPQHSTGIALLCLQNSTFYWHCLQVHFLYWITRPLREAGWWTLINLFWTSSFSAIEHPSTSNKDWEIAPYMPSDSPKYVRIECFVLFLTNSPRQIYHSCFLATCSPKWPPKEGGGGLIEFVLSKLLPRGSGPSKYIRWQ